MSPHESVSEEQLNAFLDGQLDDEEGRFILSAIETDAALASRFHKLRLLMDEMSLAYHRPPGIEQGAHRASVKPEGAPLRAFAAVILLCLLSAGVGHYFWMDERPIKIQDLALMTPATGKENKIILHISSMDPKRIENVLRTTKKLLSESTAQQRDLQLEVIANADGIGLLRKDSPYAAQIAAISRAHKNVDFLACGLALETIRLKEGHDMPLIPQAHKVDAALEQIMVRLKQGWRYVKG